MSDAVSPLASPFPALPAIAGATPHAVRAGYKDWGRCDLTYVALAEGTAVAGVFTRNVCCSSEVDLGREGVKQGRARALVVNAGNSNAFTGAAGIAKNRSTVAAVRQLTDCPPHEVFLAATGVIGEPLPDNFVANGLARAWPALQPAIQSAWERAANAIRTTDTFAKAAGETVTLNRRHVAIAGVAGGALIALTVAISRGLA